MIENKTDDKATNYIENVKVTVENNWELENNREKAWTQQK